MDNLKYWAENWDWESAYSADDDGYKMPLKMLQACEDQGIPTVQKHAIENYEVVDFHTRLKRLTATYLGEVYE
jgi:hypothetical protein